MAQLEAFVARNSRLPLSLVERRIRWSALVVGLMLLFVVLVTGAGAGLETSARTMRDGWRVHRASGEVVVVEIDARSLSRLDHWPWPRSLYATAIDRLHADGARSIGFDVDFSARSQSSEDLRLAKALHKAGGSVILPTFRQRADAHSDGWIESLPIPMLRPLAFLAAVNVMPDPDGVVRNYSLGVPTGGLPRPSLGAMLAETNAISGHAFPIDYATDPDTIDRISFVDLVRGRVPAYRISGKRVLIGATAIEVGDRYPVPGRGIMPGVTVQALATETLIRSGIRTSRGALPLAIVAALLLFAATRAHDHRLWLGSTLGIAVALPLMPLPFEAAGCELNMVPSLAAVLGTFAMGLAMVVLEELRHRRFVDRESGLPNGAALESAARGMASIDITVARFERLDEITVAVGSAVSSQALRQIAQRLEGVLATPIYRVEDDSLAWVSAAGAAEDEDEHFVGLGSVLRAPVVVDGVSLDVLPTFGVAGGDGCDALKLAAGAAIAARRIRTTGGRWDRYVDGDGDTGRWKLSLLGEFEAALVAGEIWVAHQPKYDVAQGRVTASEALIRWKHPTRGAILPDSFIPLIEEEGRAAELTAYVLDRALCDVALWRAAGLEIGVAVNLSATLLNDPAFVPEVEATLARHGVPSVMLTLELTESAIIADADAASGALTALKALGVKLSIDDYGTGQSTLSYLKRVPASELKIDKSFVQGIVVNPGDRLLVQSTIELAHARGMTVVCEGVEDQACFDALVGMGCDTIQGWFTGRPMPADDFAAKLMPFVARAA